MAVNIKLKAKFAIDRATDSMGRAWAGWDEDASDQVNWDHNRGRAHLWRPRRQRALRDAVVRRQDPPRRRVEWSRAGVEPPRCWQEVVAGGTCLAAR